MDGRASEVGQNFKKEFMEFSKLISRFSRGTFSCGI